MLMNIHTARTEAHCALLLLTWDPFGLAFGNWPSARLISLVAPYQPSVMKNRQSDIRGMHSRHNRL